MEQENLFDDEVVVEKAEEKTVYSEEHPPTHEVVVESPEVKGKDTEGTVAAPVLKEASTPRYGHTHNNMTRKIISE